MPHKGQRLNLREMLSAYEDAAGSHGGGLDIIDIYLSIFFFFVLNLEEKSIPPTLFTSCRNEKTSNKTE